MHSLTHSIDIFHFQCSPTEKENLNHKKYHFKFFNIYLQVEHVAECERICVYASLLACGYLNWLVLAKHSSYYCPLVTFSQSVRSFKVSVHSWMDCVMLFVCVCVFRIHSSFGKFSAIFPKKRESTLSRAFEKLSFSNKFLAFQLSNVCRSRCLGVYVPVLHACNCNMSHVSVKSRSVYTYHRPGFFSSSLFKCIQICFTHTMQCEPFYR